MKRSARFGIGALCTIAVSVSALLSHAGQLVLFNQNPNNGAARGFYQLNPDNAQATLISEVSFLSGDSYSTAFAWHPVDRQVYVPTQQGRLYTLDYVTGHANLVGQIPVNNSPPFHWIDGLSFQPGTHDLFGFGCCFLLYKIDSATANSQEVGLTSTIGSLAFSPDGRLYAVGRASGLFEIDSNTGEELSQISVAGGPYSDMTFTPDGRLFAVQSQLGRVVEIAPDTGIVTSIGDIPGMNNGLVGIFYVVPEPPGFSMVLGASICLFGRCCWGKKVTASTYDRRILDLGTTRDPRI